MILHGAIGQHRVIPKHRAYVIDPGNIRGGKNSSNACACPHRVQVKLSDLTGGNLALVFLPVIKPVSS